MPFSSYFAAPWLAQRRLCLNDRLLFCPIWNRLTASCDEVGLARLSNRGLSPNGYRSSLRRLVSSVTWSFWSVLTRLIKSVSCLLSIFWGTCLIVLCFNALVYLYMLRCWRCSDYKIKCSSAGDVPRWGKGPRGDDQRLYLTSALTARPIAKSNDALVWTTPILIVP